MSKKISVTFDTKVLDGIIKSCNGNVADAVAKAAFTVEANAKILAPTDTGALKSSIYTNLKRGSSGSEAMDAARVLRPDAKVGPLPEPENEHIAYVGPSVEYGLAVEIGTSRRAATPYLVPAVRKAQKDLLDALGNAVMNR